MGNRWGEKPSTKGIDEAASLKRIAWAFGCSPKGSEEEERLLGLLLRKVESQERGLDEVDAKLRSAADVPVDVVLTFRDPQTGAEHVLEGVSGELVVAGPGEALPDFVADIRAPDFTGIDQREARCVDSEIARVLLEEVRSFVEWFRENDDPKSPTGLVVMHVDGLQDALDRVAQIRRGG